jgi:hypothetical protein
MYRSILVLSVAALFVIAAGTALATPATMGVAASTLSTAAVGFGPHHHHHHYCPPPVVYARPTVYVETVPPPAVVYARPPVVVAPPPQVVVPAPVYTEYYRPLPSTSFYYRGRGISIGVGF